MYTVVRPGAGRLSIVPRPRGGDWLDDEMRSLRAAGVDLLVSLLTPWKAEELALTGEAGAAEQAGLAFRLFAIADRGVPPLASARALLTDLEQALMRGEHVAVHCRQSVGRAALVAAALLVMEGTDVDTAWRLVEQARGCPVPDTDAQRAWVWQLH